MGKAKSRAEIQKAYRERRKQENAEAVKQKERQRWHRRRAAKKVKCIEDMNQRDKRATRRKWREYKAAYRLQQKVNLASTPPSSSDEDHRRKRGRTKLARNHRKAYRTISKLSSQICQQKRSADKYKKRWLRLKKMSVSCKSNDDEIFALNSSQHSLKSSASLDCSTSAHSECTELVDYSLSSKSSVTSTERKVHGNSLEEKTKQLIQSFFVRDDNSRLCTGKKQTVTKNKNKMQKRLLLDTMTNLHEKFGSEYPEENIGYATFTRLRPFWVRMPMSKDRDTCLCKKHENAQLLNDKLFQLGVVKFKRVEDFLQHVCCSTDSFRCMTRTCEVCHEYSVQFQDIAVPSDTSVVVWFQWDATSHQYEKDGVQKTAKLTAKIPKRGTLIELKTLFSNTVTSILAPHVYNVRHQFKLYRHVKETIEMHEAVIHVDFSENYVCHNASEIQSAHFGASNRQVTLHTGVLYQTGSHTSFATISPSLRHDPAAIWGHLQPVLLKLRETHPEVVDLHFFSDGPTTQYRNKQNFYLLSTQIHQMGFHSATWNFFESGHGKGAPDAIGGSIKRQADSRLNAGVDIPSAEELFKVLSDEESCTELYFVKDAMINDVESKLLQHTNLQPLPGTMKLHQLITDEEFCIASRNLSCFCTRPTMCTCFNLKRSSFKHVPARNVNVSNV